MHMNDQVKSYLVENLEFNKTQAAKLWHWNGHVDVTIVETLICNIISYNLYIERDQWAECNSVVNGVKWITQRSCFLMFYSVMYK